MHHPTLISYHQSELVPHFPSICGTPGLRCRHSDRNVSWRSESL